MNVPSRVESGVPLIVHGTVSGGRGRRALFERFISDHWQVDGARVVGRSGRVRLTYGHLAVGRHIFRLVLESRDNRTLASKVAVVVVTPPKPPLLSLTFPGAADAGRAIPFNYTADNLPSAASIVLQRQMGTARTWGTVAVLPRLASGAAAAPPLGMGQYALRLAVLDSKGRVLAAKAVALTVYGDVSLGALLGITSPYTTVAAGHTFSFVIYGSAGDQDQYIFTNSSRCRRIHLDLARDDHNTAITEIVTVVQESRDPVSVAVAADSITSLDADVVPGQSWAVNVHPAVPPAAIAVYTNGSANCFSSQGVDH